MIYARGHVLCLPPCLCVLRRDPRVVYGLHLHRFIVGQQKGVQPSGVSAEADVGKRLCSFDGDADRLVYHFFDET